MSFFPLEQLSRLHDGYQRAFNVDGVALLLCQWEGKVVLMRNRCPHMDVALSDGTLLPDNRIRCRAHGIEFDLASGRACGPLAETLNPLKFYSPVYEGTQVGVDIVKLLADEDC